MRELGNLPKAYDMQSRGDLEVIKEAIKHLNDRDLAVRARYVMSVSLYHLYIHKESYQT